MFSLSFSKSDFSLSSRTMKSKAKSNRLILVRAAPEDGIPSLDCKQPLHFNILLSTPVNSKYFIKNLDRYQVVDIAISQKTQLTYMYTFFGPQ